jgi:hypothetical protein
MGVLLDELPIIVDSFMKLLSKIVIIFCDVFFIMGNEPYCSLLGMLPVSYDLNHSIPVWNKIHYHI